MQLTVTARSSLSFIRQKKRDRLHPIDGLTTTDEEMSICKKLSTVDVKFCGVCFEEDDGCTDSQYIMWVECDMCKIWMHKKCSITDHSLCLGCYSTQQCPNPKIVQSPIGNAAVQNSDQPGAGAVQHFRPGLEADHGAEQN